MEPARFVPAQWRVSAGTGAGTSWKQAARFMPARCQIHARKSCFFRPSPHTSAPCKNVLVQLFLLCVRSTFDSAAAVAAGALTRRALLARRQGGAAPAAIGAAGAAASVVIIERARLGPRAAFLRVSTRHRPRPRPWRPPLRLRLRRRRRSRGRRRRRRRASAARQPWRPSAAPWLSTRRR